MESEAPPLVLDPFCGEGTVLALANAWGLDALGLERHYAVHSYGQLRSLQLMRLARGLPPEPPRTHAIGRCAARADGALAGRVRALACRRRRCEHEGRGGGS